LQGEREADAAPVPVAGSDGDADLTGADERRSLREDIEDLLVDARTWLDAEFAYQKSRAGFVASSLKTALACILGALTIALIALIGLTVGAIMALVPVVGTVGATGIVVGVLLVVCAILLGTAAARWRDISAAIREDTVSDNKDQA
jgi:VIT1/CCC1 family predicted Fe2+/Mn2+ transporter